MMDKVPHFSTFGKNYTRRFKDTGLFEQIFSHILQECYKFKLIDPSEVFVDSTHVKARANNKKMQKRIAHDEALFFEDLLKQDVIGCHPCINTTSLNLKTVDILEKFLPYTSHSYAVVTLTGEA